jgi:aspartate-semialdehyde dehydrogenase
MNSSFFAQPKSLTTPIEVAVVGATGVVGQRLLALSSHAPWIKVVEVAASSARSGQIFGQICSWRDVAQMPHPIGQLICSDTANISAPYILSCLPSDVAEECELGWAQKGHHVFSNASAFRMNPHVPLLIPEVNADHLSLIQNQTTTGKIITNPNCSATGIALALAPIVRHTRIRHVSIVTLQSISGAGYPGISSMDVLGNTIPDIPGEAEKISQELKKILGKPGLACTLPITATVHRVPVLYGHVATLHILLDRECSEAEIGSLYHQWNLEMGQELFMGYKPSDRPQARRDLSENDMRIHIGPILQGSGTLMLSFNILSHNLVRGAAGAVLANLRCFLNQ